MKNPESKVKITKVTNVFHDKDSCRQRTESASNTDNDDDDEQRENGNMEDDNITRDAILQWQVQDVVQWAAATKQFTADVMKCLQLEEIDGQVLLCLSEEDVRDFRYRLNYNLRFGELKKLWNTICCLQQKCHECTTANANAATAATTAHQHLHHAVGGAGICVQQQPLLRCSKQLNLRINSNLGPDVSPIHQHHYYNHNNRHLHRNPSLGGVQTCNGRNCNIPCGSLMDAFNDCESCGAPEVSSVSEGCSVNIPPEFFKTAISLGYSFVVTWITSFVMVIVHERVPDMKRYPPLPDIFLDNVPHIPWAFHMCEITGTLLFSIWACVCIFHKYRMVILRRFFALAGTVFLLRCVTMLITSLSVPGTHLQCNQNDYAIDDTSLTLTEAIYLRISRAYTIWSGLGMSIQGVRTCGDYMFSGHTVALTLLNFFITEYTPRNLYFLHTLSWLLNMFGIFFILAAHEHYSIDVFVAFYITSRLFLYYHTLANNQALMQRDSKRTRIWFPMFSYFESSVDGIIPNEFDSVSEIIDQLLHLLMELKDMIMLTTYRLWLEAPHFNISSKNVLFVPREVLARKQQRNAATSTTITASNTPTTTTTRQAMEFWQNTDDNNKEDLNVPIVSSSKKPIIQNSKMLLQDISLANDNTESKQDFLKSNYLSEQQKQQQIALNNNTQKDNSTMKKLS